MGKTGQTKNSSLLTSIREVSPQDTLLSWDLTESQLVEAEISMETIAVETIAMVEKPQVGWTHCWRLGGTGLRLSGDSGGAKGL